MSHAAQHCAQAMIANKMAREIKHCHVAHGLTSTFVVGWLRLVQQHVQRKVVFLFCSNVRDVA